ncbi:hypothetical protein D3C72_1491420 [compost metagenome]
MPWLSRPAVEITPWLATVTAPLPDSALIAALSALVVVTAPVVVIVVLPSMFCVRMPELKNPAVAKLSAVTVMSLWSLVAKMAALLAPWVAPEAISIVIAPDPAVAPDEMARTASLLSLPPVVTEPAVISSAPPVAWAMMPWLLL